MQHTLVGMHTRQQLPGYSQSNSQNNQPQILCRGTALYHSKVIVCSRQHSSQVRHTAAPPVWGQGQATRRSLTLHSTHTSEISLSSQKTLEAVPIMDSAHASSAHGADTSNGQPYQTTCVTVDPASFPWTHPGQEQNQSCIHSTNTYISTP